MMKKKNVLKASHFSNNEKEQEEKCENFSN